MRGGGNWREMMCIQFKENAVRGFPGEVNPSSSGLPSVRLSSCIQCTLHIIIRFFIIRESAVLGYGVKRGLCSRGGISSQRPGSEATGNTRARPPVENSIQRRVDRRHYFYGARRNERRRTHRFRHFTTTAPLPSRLLGQKKILSFGPALSLTHECQIKNFAFTTPDCESKVKNEVNDIISYRPI